MSDKNVSPPDTVSFVLRGGSETFEYEMFPREGYGLFIVFLYVFVLPAPVVYYYFMESNAVDDGKDTPDVSDNFEFDNPLDDFDNNSDAPLPSSSRARPPSSGGGSNSGGTSTVRLAKLQREGKELRTINQAQDAELQAKAAEIDALQQELARVGGTVTVAAANDASAPKMDSPPLAPPPPPPAPVDPRQKKLDQLKVFIEDETLTEEYRNAAKKAVLEHAGVQIRSSKTEPARMLMRVEDVHFKQQMESVRLRDIGASEVALAARSSLRQFLGDQRLIEHEDKFLQAGGRDLSAADLVHFRDEEIDVISSDMTFVEKNGLSTPSTVSRVQVRQSSCEAFSHQTCLGKRTAVICIDVALCPPD